MEDVIAELKPNSKKIILLNFLKVLTAVLVIVGIIFFINMFVDLNVFKELFPADESGFDIKMAVTSTFFLAGFIITAILFLDYLMLSKVRYAFYNDSLKYRQNFLIMQTSELSIPYNNIVKVTFEKIPVLNTGSIIIELTGMKEKSIELKFIDNTEQVTSDILKLINEYRSRYYSKKSEEYKYDGILNKEAF